MSEANEEALEQAYELIEADKLAEAEALLKPVLERDPDNIDAWWLYAHAVRDPDWLVWRSIRSSAWTQALKVRRTCWNGLTILMSQPVHPRCLTTTMMFLTPRIFSKTVTRTKMNSWVQKMILSSTKTFFQETTLQTEQSRGGRRLLLVVPILLLVLLIALIVVIINPFGSQAPEATPTTVAQQSTLPAATDAPDSSAMSVTSPASEAMNTAISDALTDFEVAEDSVGTIDTTLGSTPWPGLRR